MGVITLIISICMLIATYILDKKEKSISPIKLFYLLWTFILILSNIHITDLKQPSNEAYELILLMQIFFFIGYIINKFTCERKNKDAQTCEKDDKNKEKVNIELRYKIFYILCTVVLLINIIDLIIVIKQRVQGIPMWQIRNWSLEPYGSINPILSRRSFIEELIRTIIIEPFSMLIYPISAYYIFHTKEKRKYIILALSVAILVISSIASAGSRLLYIYFFGCYLLSFLILAKQENKSKQENLMVRKYKKVILILGIIMIVAIILFTTIRAGKGEVFRQAYKYFALPPTLLSLWLPTIENYNHTYGLLSSFGIHSYFFRFFEKIGLNNIVPNIYCDSYSYILGAEKFLDVGDGLGNAFVTPIYYFYIDGGIPFICIASMIFGFIVSKIYDKQRKNMDVRNFILYILIMYGVFVSFMRIQTAIPSYIISIVMAILLTGRKNKKIENKKIL